MSYSRIGAVTIGGTPAVVASRPLLGDMLSKLTLIANSSLNFNGKTASQFKILPSNAPDLDPEPCSGGGLPQGFGQCSGNILLWPSGDYALLEQAWVVCSTFVGSTKAFALRLTNVATAIAYTQQLLAEVDAAMRSSNLPIKTASTNYLPWIIGGGVLLGGVLALKRGKSAPKRRRARRRRR